MLPRYSPKMVLLMREDEEVPLILKKLAVAYALRFDVHEIGYSLAL